MRAWAHPTLGRIDPLPPAMRPTKVWKHFYSAAEHWERLCGQDVSKLRTQAEVALGILREHHDEFPGMEGESGRRGRLLCGHHHDVLYGPAYQNEIASPETVWTRQPDAQQRRRALTPRSVFVVVQFDPSAWVVTAFRPHPPSRGVEWEEADLRRYGAGYFRKETGMEIKDLTRATAENLRRASSVPIDSVQALWWLASAVGYGRLLNDHAEVRAVLPAAERALAEVGTDLLDELRRALDWDGSRRRLASALKETRSEDAEEALAAIEELLAVAGAVGAGAHAEAFCAEAEALIAWLPAEWTHLGQQAAARCSAFGPSPHGVPRMWATVEEALLGAAIRTLVPAVRPVARWTDALLPPMPRWTLWRERVVARTQDLSTAVAEWVRASLDGIRITSPAPAMGGVGASAEPSEVRVDPPPNAPCFRAFVVDEDHPDGCEVTAHFSAPDGYVWQMNPGDEGALIVLVASRSPILGADLNQVMEQAATGDDTFVEAREISPPR